MAHFEENFQPVVESMNQAINRELLDLALRDLEEQDISAVLDRGQQQDLIAALEQEILLLTQAHTKMVEAAESRPLNAVEQLIFGKAREMGERMVMYYKRLLLVARQFEELHVTKKEDLQ